MTALRYQRSQRWLLWGVGLVFLIVQARFIDSVLAGSFPDNDDMLRLQQVRDLLAGQSWFNVDQARFLTPEGGELHWSRLPDIFIGGLILLVRPILGQAGAEVFTLIVYPLALFVWALVMVTQIARRLGASVSGQVAAIVLFALSVGAYRFWPGRIDHHNLVVVLILTSIMAMLSPRLSARSAVIAAFCCVAALSVAVESLPYIGAMTIGFGLLWIVRGHTEGVRLASFGFGLMVFAIVFYALDAPGSSPRRYVCDAYGQAHFAGLLSGGFLFGMLGIFGGWFDTWAKRLGIGVFAGLVTLGIVIVVNPACLGDPYAEVSEQVRIGWLSVVSEALSLPSLWRTQPAEVIWKFGFIIAGLVALVITLWRAQPQHRLPRMIFSLFFILAVLATIWQIRGATFSHIFAAIIGGVLIGEVFSRWYNHRGSANAVALLAAILVLSPASWQIVSQQLTADHAKAQRTAPDGQLYNAVCLEPEAYDALGSLASADVLTPIDLGMSLLIRSEHRVFGGPYHRNLLGIERVTRAYMSSPEDARVQINAMGATHVLYCAGLNETARYARLEPESFAAHMEQGILPDWLEPVDGKDGFDGVVRLYRVKPL